ncbi:MAG TPA: PilZ domain-containing protein [Acidobacteriaceae bacterium]|nr:PilZ domain-containing protein [Acidobacteriaceae bacterium]
MPLSAPATDPVRAAVRFPLHLDLTLSTDEREYRAVTEDVSSAGLLFASEEVPPLDSTVRFQIKMPAAIMGGPDDVVLECVGRIVRHDFAGGRNMAAAVIDKYSLKAEQQHER